MPQVTKHKRMIETSYQDKVDCSAGSCAYMYILRQGIHFQALLYLQYRHMCVRECDTIRSIDLILLRIG